MLEIEDLYVEIEGKPILQGVNLNIRPGEIHAIMGPNGAGKSTLAKVLAGHPAYEVVGGSIRFEGKDILDLPPEERGNLGLFLSFQYPPEIMGVTLPHFLFEAYKTRHPKVTQEEFNKILDEKMALLEMPLSFKERNLNEGFSGGEKKRSEILQMAVLSPKLAILDETDSGLDIDALKVVASSVKKVQSKETSLLVITHYSRLLDYLNPDFIHIFINGKIVTSGGSEIATMLEKTGYESHVSRA